LLTEPEYQRAKDLAAEHGPNQYVARARQILADDFRDDSAIGILRLKEHPLYRPTFPAAEMADALRDIFGVTAPG
jgi:hypothetical protein